MLTPMGGGPAAFTCAPTTDQQGDFVCGSVPTGSFVACAKHSHTLRSCTAVDVSPGVNPVDFGVLREGDADDSNCILLVDFSILVQTFSKCSGEAGYDPRADFDVNGCVVLIDFSLLATNFGQCGDEPPGP
jgi:hypothetical protein